MNYKNCEKLNKSFDITHEMKKSMRKFAIEETFFSLLHLDEYLSGILFSMDRIHDSIPLIHANSQNQELSEQMQKALYCLEAEAGKRIYTIFKRGENEL